MFKIITQPLVVRTRFTLPPDTYLAVGIAPDSILDVCEINGRIVGPGGPLLLDGAKQSPTVRGIRGLAEGAAPIVSLFAITKACGLPALGAFGARNRLLFNQKLVWGAGDTGEFTIPFYGRRHATISLDTGVALSTFEVRAWRYQAQTSDSHSKLIVPTYALGANVYSFEVGGTDHEECWDELEVLIESNGGAVANGRLIAEAYGELGR